MLQWLGITPHDAILRARCRRVRRISRTSAGLSAAAASYHKCGAWCCGCLHCMPTEARPLVSDSTPQLVVGSTGLPGLRNLQLCFSAVPSLPQAATAHRGSRTLRRRGCNLRRDPGHWPRHVPEEAHQPRADRVLDGVCPRPGAGREAERENTAGARHWCRQGVVHARRLRGLGQRSGSGGVGRKASARQGPVLRPATSTSINH
mmetsp:Transcript_73272/g.131946  ORF Transcript_73272/g.131946 Transcript_73272/m.131946 type:complete len:204 (+) Transcript_73272:151-762(+)